MRTGIIAAAGAALMLVAGGAQASVTVDGTLNASEGYTLSSTVTYNSTAPTSNFGAPTSESNAIGYNIYTTSDSTYIYGLFKANPSPGAASAGPFVNLYLDTNPGTAPGSDLGYEITNHRAFIPGVAGYVATPDILVGTSADGLTIEFGIPIADLKSGTLTDGTNTITVPAVTDDVVFRLSQSFGYSVAGGDSYGPNRLASFSLAAVPEPSTLALILGGLLGLGFLRRRAGV
jgi:hypothetical protein